MGNDQICSTTLGITNCYTATSSITYELEQAQIQTQYYFQYGLDLLLIFFIAYGATKITIWKNWITTMWQKIFKK